MFLFEYYLNIYLERLRKTTKDCSQDERSLNCDLKRGPPKHKTWVLITGLQHLVQSCNNISVNAAYWWPEVVMIHWTLVLRMGSLIFGKKNYTCLYGEMLFYFLSVAVFIIKRLFLFVSGCSDMDPTSWQSMGRGWGCPRLHRRKNKSQIRRWSCKLSQNQSNGLFLTVNKQYFILLAFVFYKDDYEK